MSKVVSLRRIVIAFSLLAVGTIVLSGGAATGSTSPTTARTTLQVTTLAGDVVPALSSYADLGRVAPDKQLNVAITLQHDDAAIAALESSLNDPASTNYENWLTPDQFQTRFGAPAANVAAVRDFATRFGMQLYNSGGLGDITLVSGTAAQAEQTFGVDIHRYLTTDGREFFANTNAPTVPANAGVAGVLGLQNMVQMKRPKGPGEPGNPTPQGQCVGGVCTGLLGPSELWSVYNQPSSDLGQGETIGIIGEGRADDVIKALRRFEATRKLPVVPVQIYWTDAGAKTDDSGRVEWELDTQASTGMAPDVSQVRLYFGSDLSLSTLATTLQTWASDPYGPHQVNASLGICEDDPALDGLLGPAQTASGFALAQAAVEGRAFFSSSGDTGAGCAIVAAVNGVSYGALPTAEYPAADPNATAVGGTVVYTDGAMVNPKRVDEHAWDHTGGTRSDFIAQPAFQKNITVLQANYCASQPNGTPYATPTLCRGTSDVAALSGDGTIILNHELDGTVQADGYDMVDLDDSSGSDVYSDHFSEGGTSLSSPLWAGMWARVNAAHKRGPLGRAADTLYGVAAGPSGATAFHDIIEGANPLPATPGWDFPTGLGSPDLTNLIKAADGGNLKPVHNVLPHGSDPAPIQATGVSYGCPATFTDPAGDAASLPQSAPQLDILHGDVALSSDGTKIRAALTVNNLTTTVPTGFTAEDWIVYWTQPATGIAPPPSYTKDYYAVEVTVDLTGAVTYTDGNIAFDDSGNYQYTSTNTIGGRFVPGQNGIVEADAPVADVGQLVSGSQLGTVGGATDEGNLVTGLIVDTAAGSGSWSLGSPSCLG
jgi:pseudomonalisin